MLTVIIWIAALLIIWNGAFSAVANLRKWRAERAVRKVFAPGAGLDRV